MEAKAYALIMVALIAGLIGGYYVSSSTFQNQIIILQLQITNQETTISRLQADYTKLQNNYTQLLSLYTTLLLSQTQQAQTQVRIDSVDWSVAGQIRVSIRNTGSVTATIESISVRKNVVGSTAVTVSYIPSISVNVGNTIQLTWNGPLDPNTSYIVRVTCSTGFYYEMVATSSSQSTQAQTQVRIDSVAWSSGTTATVTIRNTGSVACTIESISVKPNTPSGTWQTTSFTTGNGYNVGEARALTWSGTYAATTSYIDRATTTTGFYYEMVVSTP